MLKSKLFPLLAGSLLSLSPLTTLADTTEETERQVSESLIALKGQIQSINEELSNHRAQLGSIKAEVNAQSDDSTKSQRELLKELKALRRQNQSLVDSLYDAGFGKSSNSEVKPLRNYDLQTPDGKMFFGEDEFFYVKEADATFDARIDTGAAVSSISAKDITEFERNGKRWYRFVIESNDQSIQVEAPFVRYSTIRQSSKETTTERVVVSLNVKIGNYSTSSEFTLTDRTRMQYPLLIGRTLIQDIAVVDVSRDHIQPRNKDTLLILNRDDYNEAKKKGIDPNAEYHAKKNSMAGQIASPSDSYGANLGPNSESALPAVRNKKTEGEANTQLIATPASKVAKDDKDAKATKDEPKADEAKAKDASKDSAKADNKAKADVKSDTKTAKDDKVSKADKADKKDSKDNKSKKSDTEHSDK